LFILCYVREEVKSAAEKWLKMGVDGFRLDAAIHIYGDNEYKQMDSQTDASLNKNMKKMHDYKHSS